MPITEAAEWSAGQDAIEVGRSRVLNSVSAGLVKARAFRSRRTILGFPLSDDAVVRSIIDQHEWLEDCGLSYIGGDGIRREISDGRELRASDVRRYLKVADGAWHRVETYGAQLRCEVKTDWSLGCFHCRTLNYSVSHWPDGEEPTGFTLSEEDWYSVEVESEAFARIVVGGAGNAKMPGSVTRAGLGRGTKYDWEAAFADVAARFYYDLQFENVHANGVQKDVMNALRESFVSRRLAVPDDSSLKQKARIIVAALRAK